MIQDKDLRIGNEFEYLIEDAISGNEWVRNTINWEDIKYCYYHKKNFNLIYRPIPLTPEILEKCGFKKIENSVQFGWYISVSNRLLCWCYSDVVSIEFKNGQCDEYNNHTFFDFPCKYLHQLQNLYFALTNEELTFKL
jgi:hypothetical protein